MIFTLFVSISAHYLSEYHSWLVFQSLEKYLFLYVLGEIDQVVALIKKQTLKNKVVMGQYHKICVWNKKTFLLVPWLNKVSFSKEIYITWN